MRKFSFGTIIAALLLVFALVGCDSTPLPTASSLPNSEPESSPVEQVSSVASEPASESNNDSEPTVAEQVLFEQDGIRLTVKSLDYSGFMGPELKVLIENDGDLPITVQTRDCSINGFMIEPMMSADVQPGKKNNDGITFMSSELEKNNIDVIGIIELKFHVFNTDTWDTIFDTEDIPIETSAAGAISTDSDAEKTVIFEQDGIVISFMDFDAESIWGLDIKFFIENNTDEPITVQSRDTSINGFMIDGMMSCDVLHGKVSNDTLSFFSTSLEENGIEEIESVELKFHIFNKDTWDAIIDTDTIVLTP